MSFHKTQEVIANVTSSDGYLIVKACEEEISKLQKLYASTDFSLTISKPGKTPCGESKEVYAILKATKNLHSESATILTYLIVYPVVRKVKKKENSEVLHDQESTDVSAEFRDDSCKQS
nr:putative ORF1 [Marmot picobirnavirus]